MKTHQKILGALMQLQSLGERTSIYCVSTPLDKKLSHLKQSKHIKDEVIRLKVIHKNQLNLHIISNKLAYGVPVENLAYPIVIYC